MNKAALGYLDLLMARARAVLQMAKVWWNSAERNQRRIASVIAICIGMCGIYVMSKGEEASKTKVLTSRNAEFKKSRILGDPYATSGRAKEELFSKTAKEYSDTQKMVMDGLSEINSRIDLIEKKVAGINGNDAQTASAPGWAEPAQAGPSPEPSSGADVTPLPITPEAESSRGPIDMSPIMPRAVERRRYSEYGGDVDEKRGLQSPKGPPIISFPVQGAPLRERSEVVLPVGSYVKAKLLTGVEAPEGNPYPVLLQLDFANILPNKKSLDLRGCFMIAKAQGDLSTERVQMQATKLSCVSRGGQMFERDINGFVADAADNSFAVMGTVNTKQDRVAAMAFLSSVVEGVGRAIQMAQTSEQSSPEGTSRRTLTGDQGKYIAAGGASSAAGMVAQWYLKQAQSLLPTINVGSGQDVWVVMNETIALPHEYFKKVSLGESHGKDYSLVNRLFD